MFASVVGVFWDCMVLKIFYTFLGFDKITHIFKQKYFTDITHDKIVQNVRGFAALNGYITCAF